MFGRRSCLLTTCCAREQPDRGRNATYADWCRRWNPSTLPLHPLDRLVQAHTTTTQTLEAQQERSPRWVDASYESVHNAAANPTAAAAASFSLLHPPLRWDPAAATKPSASDDLRSYWTAREQCHKDETQMRSLQRSWRYQQRIQEDIQRRKGLSQSVDLALLEEVKVMEENSGRVTAQLKRQMSALEQPLQQHKQSLVLSQSRALQSYRHHRLQSCAFRAPTDASALVKAGNGVFWSLLSREQPRIGCRPLTLSMNTAAVQRELLCHRLSHAVTINTHMACPVYCLKFDRTGRYFITGADDSLVKVFGFGDSLVRAGRTTRVRSQESMATKLSRSSYVRGAILVATLRGHAGVINDIDVSCDNALLATASEDGDCRVWGLRDGTPVAILRGHEGGCNMVAWSRTCPYRLVTTGCDGLARTWDIRQACLQRYKVVSKRPEYRLELTARELELLKPTARSAPTAAAAAAGPSIPLPPLPVRNPEETAAVPAADPASAVAPLLVPPLPPPHQENMEVVDIAQAPAPLERIESPIIQRRSRNSRAEQQRPGAFVANAALDQGVVLVEKFQHGLTVEERLVGPGTRARRSAVKVICAAMCPRGGHFATGTDDGVCRLWREEVDVALEIMDARGQSPGPTRFRRKWLLSALSEWMLPVS
jgi:WD domain, G-beta repeat